MSSQPETLAGVSLGECLRMPDIKEAPALEHSGGQVVRKAMPKRKPGLLTKRPAIRLDPFAEVFGGPILRRPDRPAEGEADRA